MKQITALMTAPRRLAAYVAIALMALGLPAAAAPLALVGARVIVKPGVAIDNATVIIEDGVVAAVGQGIAVPAGARTVDASGGIITAGFIDGFSLVGLNEIDQEEATNDGAFSPARTPMRATYRAADAIDPFSIMRATVRSVGITSVVAAPRGVLLAGQSAWSSMATQARQPLLSIAAMHGDLGPEATALQSRGGGIDLLRAALVETRAWMGNKAAVARAPHPKALLSPAELRTLEPVLTKQLPLVLYAHAVADILAAIGLAREFDLRVVIAGGAEAWLVADELAAAQVAVIIDPQDIVPGHVDAPRVVVDAPVRLRAAGVQVAFSTLNDPPASVGLRQVAGIAVANGLAYDDALAALTTVPASMYRGAPGKANLLPTGTLEVGARADLVLWSGDPFELATWAKAVVIGGVEQPTDTRQQVLFRRYR